MEVISRSVALVINQQVPEVVNYPGPDGFLGCRGSFMMDVVVVAMALVLGVMSFSIFQVRSKRKFQFHKQIQLALGIVLLLAITAFEIDVQFFSTWEERAAVSPFFDQTNQWSSPAGISLLVHLCFAVPTVVLWTVVIVQALRHFPSPAAPGSHSPSHRIWAWGGALQMLGTTLTGWAFYWLAFVAS